MLFIDVLLDEKLEGPVHVQVKGVVKVTLAAPSATEVQEELFKLRVGLKGAGFNKLTVLVNEHPLMSVIVNVFEFTAPPQTEPIWLLFGPEVPANVYANWPPTGSKAMAPSHLS